ncbi:hypothetical protein MIMGU_mgv1a024672mg, partial [Erythranthe guttata]
CESIVERGMSIRNVLEIARKFRVRPDDVFMYVSNFKGLGFTEGTITRVLETSPMSIMFNEVEIRNKVDFLTKIGVRIGVIDKNIRAAIKDQIFRNGEFRAGYEAKLRIDCLRKHELIHRDAFTVLWKEPRVIIYDVGDIEKKIAFLVNTRKFDIRCIVEIPEYLGVNFEKQMVPRFNLIEYLRASDGLEDEVRKSPEKGFNGELKDR